MFRHSYHSMLDGCNVLIGLVKLDAQPLRSQEV